MFSEKARSRAPVCERRVPETKGTRRGFYSSGALFHSIRSPHSSHQRRRRPDVAVVEKESIESLAADCIRPLAFSSLLP